MSDCDSCSGCPASAEPGTCEEVGKSAAAFTIGGVEYETRPETSGCRGCMALHIDDLCESLSFERECSDNKIIFVRKTQRLSPTDFDQLKAQAIEKHAGEWLHHWGRLVEEEALRRNGIEVSA